MSDTSFLFHGGIIFQHDSPAEWCIFAILARVSKFLCGRSRALHLLLLLWNRRSFYHCFRAQNKSQICFWLSEKLHVSSALQFILLDDSNVSTWLDLSHRRFQESISLFFKVLKIWKVNLETLDFVLFVWTGGSENGSSWMVANETARFLLRNKFWHLR